MKKTITRSLAVLLTVLLVFGVMPLTAFAADTDGTCGSGVYWDFSNGTLTISCQKNNGKMDNYSNKSTPRGRITKVRSPRSSWRASSKSATTLFTAWKT